MQGTKIPRVLEHLSLLTNTRICVLQEKICMVTKTQCSQTNKYIVFSPKLGTNLVHELKSRDAEVRGSWDT